MTITQQNSDQSNGNITTYTYDVHGNLLSQTVEAAAGSTTGSPAGSSAGVSTVSYTYDNNGNTLTMTDTTGTTTRVYDSFNRTTAKTVPDMGTSTYAYDITAGMDAGCTAQTTTDPKGNVTKKIYDRVGRISEVIADGLTTVYHYNDNGSVQSVIYSDGSREDYTYTSDNHLDTLTNTKSDSTVIDTYSYTYDAAHNMLSKVDARGTTAYTYDTLNRLLTVTEPSGKTTGYTYDASGNRLTETDTLGTDITVITYTYDTQNRLTGTVTTLAESMVVTGDEGTAAITTIGAAAVTSTVAYTYDNNGNQLSKTTTAYIEGVAQTEVVDQANVYDLFNQLIATVTSAGVIVINTYNGDGLRVGKSVNGELTRYLYEYQKVVLEENAAGDQTGRNVYGINLLTRQAKDDTDTPAYTLTYMYNGHADVTALMDTAGNVVATYYYDAFGNILAQTGTVNNSILYTGYQYDKETGLYYLNARMYDPITARFMQEDTYTGEYNDPLSLNLYTYCKNEPLMYSDPTGHNTMEDYNYQLDMKTAANKRNRENYEKYEYMPNKGFVTAPKKQSVKSITSTTPALSAPTPCPTPTPTNITTAAKNSTYIDPDSVGPTCQGVVRAGASTLVGVSSGVLQSAYKGSMFIPSLAEKLFLNTDQLESNSQRICDDMDNYLVSNPQIIDKDAYNVGKPGGAAIFILASLPEMAQSVVNLGQYLPKAAQGFSNVGSVMSGGEAALAWSSTVSITVDVGAATGNAALASYWTGQVVSSYNGIMEGSGSAGQSLPDDATVVRGGESKADDLIKNQKKGDDGTLSANGGTGLSEAELSNGLPQNKISTTTAGELRAKGYDVVSSPTVDNPNHVSITTPGGKVLTEVEAAKLQSTFTIKPNPSKIK